MSDDLSLKSPAEIDLLWEPLEVKLGRILDLLSSYKRRAEELRASGKERDEYQASVYDGYYAEYKAEKAGEVASLKLAIEPLEAEWQRRGGWSRYWLCVSDGGHVHYRNCHSLRWNSRLAWMPMLSGLDENGMVEKVGFKACTFCFPSAPLHPAWARSEAAAKKSSADEKLAKWEKGLAMRQKKVDNARKRLDKGQAKLLRAASLSGDQERWERIEAESMIRYASEDLKWGEKELARWLAKKPA